jgi:predicted HTH transcriptional regulator
MELFIIFVVLVIGFSLGWNTREKYAEYKMQSLLKKINSQIEEEEENKEDFLIITIEKHKDILFCYDKDTSSFLTQANTKKELEENLRKMFPGKRFYASQENLKEIES